MKNSKRATEVNQLESRLIKSRGESVSSRGLDFRIISTVHHKTLFWGLNADRKPCHVQLNRPAGKPGSSHVTLHRGYRSR